MSILRKNASSAPGTTFIRSASPKEASRLRRPKVLIWIGRRFGNLYDDGAVVGALMAGVAGCRKLCIGFGKLGSIAALDRRRHVVHWGLGGCRDQIGLVHRPVRRYRVRHPFERSLQLAKLIGRVCPILLMPGQ